MMEPSTMIVNFLVYAALAGLLGALAMTTVMRVISRTRIGDGDMIVAVGSLLTRTRENARLVGAIMHGISAVAFGQLYSALLIGLEANAWPGGVFAGLGLGVFHGIVVSLTLVWLVADHHPLPEFRQAGPAVFLEHFAGHAAYGLVVGVVVALSPV
jgi:hypothetical protein